MMYVRDGSGFFFSVACHCTAILYAASFDSVPYIGISRVHVTPGTGLPEE